jgi:hypothetical protein
MSNYKFVMTQKVRNDQFSCIGVWQEMTMDCLKFYLDPPFPTLLCPAGGRAGHPQNALMAYSRARQARQPATVFYPLGHPTPYAYDFYD